jgi:hypothetical protein
MVVGMLRSCYTAPCRWYENGPVGLIRFYRASADAAILPVPTVFWPYSQLLELHNRSDPGELTGPGLRRWDRGENFNSLDGDHYEGTAEDFAGNGILPS